MSYIGEQYTIKEILLDGNGAPITPATAQIRIQLPDGSETGLLSATVNSNEVSYNYTPQMAGAFGYTIKTATPVVIRTGYFNVESKEGLTPQARSAMDELQVAVSVEVDEYLEKATNVNDIAIPVGDIPLYLHEGAKEVIRRLDRIQALDLTKEAVAPFAVSDASKAQSIVPLPEDFYRFISLKLSSFHQPVTEHVPQTSSAYRLQQFSQRRGTSARPFVSLIPYHKSYSAGTVPTGKVYATIVKHPEQGEYIRVGDTITGGGGTGYVESIDDPDFVIVNATTPFTKNSTVTITDKTYQLKMGLIAGDTITRPSHGKALECYPNGSVEELSYVPILKAYELDAMYHLAMIKFATYRVFVSMRLGDLAKLALDDFALIIQSFNSGQRGQESNE